MNNKKIEGTEITLYGSDKEIKFAEEKISNLKLTGEEGEDRIALQNYVVDDVKASILYDGNSVYSKTKLISHFKRLLKNGMQSLTDELYKFFHLCCGTIAHYNKQGWIAAYPDLYALKQLFRRNDFGQIVSPSQPCWATDRIVIIEEMGKLLYAIEKEIIADQDKKVEQRLTQLETDVKRAKSDKKFAKELTEEVFGK